MEQTFIKVLNMSLTAGFVILAVILIRLTLRRAPKIFSYLLWLVVLFRLLCPFSFSLNISFLGILNVPVPQLGEISYIPENIGLMEQPEVDLPGTILPDIVNSSLPAGTPENSMNPMQGILFVGACLWIAGIIIMLACSIAAYVRLRRRLKGAVRETGEGNIYRTNSVTMPFVYGLLRPVIYLPYGLEENEKAYILLHEQIHIRRGDQLWRRLGYLALCIHWFNPFVWVAFYLSGKDMEMSCDEAVVRKMGDHIKKEYAASILSLACGRRIMPALPLAFGEEQTGDRIKNLSRYKKARKGTVVILGAICLIAAIVLIVNPGSDNRNGGKTGLSCYTIPIGDGRLSWGMSREELIAIFGEPAAEELLDGGSILTYDVPMQSELGKISQVILDVGIQNLTDPKATEGEKLSSGLCGIRLTLDPTTKEAVLKKLSGFYGKLSPSGGSTQMELQLQAGNPNYFNELHFCEDWRLQNLPEAEYERLVEIHKMNREWRPINAESLLMCIYIWGVEDGDSYPCVVQLDVSMMGVLAYLPGEK